ncbi:unnamed protein product [Dracunculus medinensis]|uniref:CYSTM domain-containing protein n=1 Tax=Dracunculus medinensis TaxID=318479 RepID=A0A0N4UER6_DRAME|nr:unnamed protein product [Dracunculus medinensis]
MSAPPPYNPSYPQQSYGPPQPGYEQQQSYVQRPGYGYGAPQQAYYGGQPGYGFPQLQPQCVNVGHRNQESKSAASNCWLWALLAFCCGCCLADCCD